MAVAVVLAGCAAQERDRSGEPTPAPPTRTAQASPPAEELALEAYRGMMGALVDGSLEGAEDHPDLDGYASGQALELTTAMLDGATATGEPVLRPQVVEADLDGDPPQVVVEDCMDNSEWVLEGHPPREASARNTRLFVATVTEQAGQWKVEELWLGEFDQC
ncbi:hypothetical protein [Nocardiopsis sp. CNT312]|uniref:hypothetical protein n=1 Tax=Nocardiopsis sp. CNT312 TaxID=1137268 RepID=UPI001E4DB40B|nr:hypothetical protein [Nocardiopsis sp. CNT312]